MKIKYYETVNHYPTVQSEIEGWGHEIHLQNGKVFHVDELPEGKLEIHCDGQMIIQPNASNMITLDEKD